MVLMNDVDKIRSDLGIPKTIIAQKCGISVRTYDNWCKDPTHVTAKAAKTMAEALNVTDSTELLAIFFAPNVQGNVNNTDE